MNCETMFLDGMRVPPQPTPQPLSQRAQPQPSSSGSSGGGGPAAQASVLGPRQEDTQSGGGSEPNDDMAEDLDPAMDERLGPFARRRVAPSPMSAGRAVVAAAAPSIRSAAAGPADPAAATGQSGTPAGGAATAERPIAPAMQGQSREGDIAARRRAVQALDSPPLPGSLSLGDASGSSSRAGTQRHMNGGSHVFGSEVRCLSWGAGSACIRRSSASQHWAH